MPVRFYCPHVTRARGFEQILCQTLFKNGAIPTTTIGKAEACCAFQYFCPVTQRWELTKGCEKCKARENGGEK